MVIEVRVFSFSFSLIIVCAVIRAFRLLSSVWMVSWLWLVLFCCSFSWISMLKGGRLFSVVCVLLL